MVAGACASGAVAGRSRDLGASLRAAGSCDRTAVREATVVLLIRSEGAPTSLREAVGEADEAGGRRRGRLALARE